MRQAGVIAAAGVVALQDGPDGMIERLADDHANARYLADALAAMPGVRRLDPARVRTNFVLFGVGDDDRWPDDVAGRDRVLRTRAAFLTELHDRGVRMIEYPKGLIRAIPHYGIERADIEAAIAAVTCSPRRDRTGAGHPGLRPGRQAATPLGICQTAVPTWWAIRANRTIPDAIKPRPQHINAHIKPTATNLPVRKRPIPDREIWNQCHVVVFPAGTR